MEEGEVLARRVPSIVLWDSEKKWKDWCVPVSCTKRGVVPKEGVQREGQALRFRLWSRLNKTTKRVRKHATVKRTVFRQLKGKQSSRMRR